MNAQELMIGNLVYCWNPSYKVPKDTYDTVISINWKHIRNCVERPNHGTYKPIPLTDQWLLKFGFNIKEKTWYSKRTNIAWTRLEVSVKEKRCILYNTNRMYFCGMVYPKSVHQLQNLYRAITGEELEVKP